MKNMYNALPVTRDYSNRLSKVDKIDKEDLHFP